MKKLALIILFVAMAAGLAFFAVQQQRLNQRYAATQQAEDAVREQFGAALESIAEIQDSLSVMLPEEQRLARMSRNAEMGGSVTQTQKEQMLGTIDDLKQSVGETRLKIEALEKSLGKNKTEMASLQRVIDNLKKSVTEREETIQRLTGEVASLSATVAGLQTDVQKGQETIAEQQGVIETKTKQLGTIYYVVASKDLSQEAGDHHRGGRLHRLRQDAPAHRCVRQRGFQGDRHQRVHRDTRERRQTPGFERPEQGELSATEALREHGEARDQGPGGILQGEVRGRHDRGVTCAPLRRGG